MNNPMMSLLTKALGQQAQEMMSKWEGMTQEQRAQEMEKIQRMSPQERNRILTQNGIDLTAFSGSNNTAPPRNTGRKFNY